MCYNSSVKIWRRTGKCCLPPTFAAGIGDAGGRLGGNSFEEVARVPKLRGKEERFCLEYVIDYNGTRAATKAGYKETDAANRAHRLLKKAEIAARVRELEKEMAERLGLSQDYVVIQLVQRYDECRAKGDNKNALKALELMGKHLGMFDKVKPGEAQAGEKLEDVL